VVECTKLAGEGRSFDSDYLERSLVMQRIECSVIIPVYNAASTLPRCLNALQHQSIDRARYEIIVVDDDSGDQSASVAGEILRGDSQSQVIGVSHGGPAAARNAGARAARGDIILFTDADCEPARDWIEQMLRPFQDPQVAGAKGIYRTYQKSLVARFVQQEYQTKYDQLARHPTIDFVDTYSAAYRREVFVASGGFDSELIMDEDQELSFRLAGKGHRLVFIPAAVVGHQHVTTAWRYLRRKYGVGYWKVFVLRVHPQKAVRDTHTPQVVKVQIGLIAVAMIATLAIIPIPRVFPITIGLWLLLLLTMLPFLIKIARRDPPVIWIAPLMIALRALGLGLGLTAGLLHFIVNPGSVTRQA
jgi:cellulose synthase/poly-beta-1,6-N-acetylglucosamine synthase-like glycosyltransferase